MNTLFISMLVLFFALIAFGGILLLSLESISPGLKRKREHLLLRWKFQREHLSPTIPDFIYYVDKSDMPETFKTMAQDIIEGMVDWPRFVTVAAQTLEEPSFRIAFEKLQEIGADPQHRAFLIKNLALLEAETDVSISRSLPVMQEQLLEPFHRSLDAFNEGLKDYDRTLEDQADEALMALLNQNFNTIVPITPLPPGSEAPAYKWPDIEQEEK